MVSGKLSDFKMRVPVQPEYYISDCVLSSTFVHHSHET